MWLWTQTSQLEFHQECTIHLVFRLIDQQPTCMSLNVAINCAWNDQHTFQVLDRLDALSTLICPVHQNFWLEKRTMENSNTCRVRILVCTGHIWLKWTISSFYLCCCYCLICSILLSIYKGKVLVDYHLTILVRSKRSPRVCVFDSFGLHPNEIEKMSTFSGGMHPHNQHHHHHQVCMLMTPALVSIVAFLVFGLEPSTTMALRNNSVRRSATPLQPKSLAEWEELFGMRSEDDWRQAWHDEKHRRCNHQLVAHMELVCDKDIYKLQRRRKKRSISTDIEYPFQKLGRKLYIIFNISHITFNFSKLAKQARFMLQARQANLFGRRLLKRISGGQVTEDKTGGGGGGDGSTGSQRYKRGITEECCGGQDGCSWEEYAEYCPANVRSRSANSL